MTKNGNVLSSDLMTERYLAESMREREEWGGKSERNEGDRRESATKGRSVEFDE